MGGVQAVSLMDSSHQLPAVPKMLDSPEVDTLLSRTEALSPATEWT